MTAPLKIGIFVMQFPKRSETFIVTKLLKLLDAGFDVQVFSIAESKDWSAFEVLANRDDVRRRVHVMPPAGPMRRVLTSGALEIAKVALTHPGSFAKYVTHTWRSQRDAHLSFLKRIYQRIRFVGHDLDILHVEFDMQALDVADLKPFLQCRVLYSARGTIQHTSMVDKMPAAFRYVDGYHFISQFLDANTRALGLAPDVPTWLIEPAIDLSLFEPRARRERHIDEPIRLVSAGRLMWAKGYELALDAIAKVVEAGVAVDYTIYGDGTYAEAIRFAIRQRGLEHCARLGGALGREQMPDAYSDSDIMVHAAIEEGFCNAVIEAQAMELPVVTSDAGGLPENVEDQVTGFVVPRRDPDAMATRIIQLARDSALRRRMGAAGRQRALARFNLDRQAEAFVRLYSELAVRAPRPIEP